MRRGIDHVRSAILHSIMGVVISLSVAMSYDLYLHPNLRGIVLLALGMTLASAFIARALWHYNRVRGWMGLLTLDPTQPLILPSKAYAAKPGSYAGTAKKAPSHLQGRGRRG